MFSLDYLRAVLAAYGAAIAKRRVMRHG